MPAVVVHVTVTSDSAAMDNPTLNSTGPPSKASASEMETMIGSRTSTVNVRLAVSPSSSVAVHVYVVAACSAAGVPETDRVALSKLSPAGSSGASR